MPQTMVQVPKPNTGPKRQSYNWATGVKISELLHFSASDTPSYRPQLASTRSYFIGGSARSEPPSKPCHRGSPVLSPWTQAYRGKSSERLWRRQKPISCSLNDVEKKLSSLVLDHSEDEIYKRHFRDNDDSNDSTEKAAVLEDASSVISTVNDKQELPSIGKEKPKSKKEIYQPTKQRNLPSKSSKRHRFCLSKYPHSSKSKRIFYVKEADEIQHEVTVDQKGLKEAWELYVLGKLSDETQCFINHRFDGKEKPKDRLVDFLDSGYRDKDRSDYMSKRKRRLFDMPYRHDDFPGASTHL